MKRTMLIVSLLVAGSLALTGCGKSDSASQEVDETRPIAQVKADAAQMDVQQLRSVAMKYKEALTAKNVEIKKLVDSLAKVPLTEKLGEEAQAITADIENLKKSANALMERFQVYYDAVKAKGGELKGLEPAP
jgi:ABC-type transporter Mla subunit MlaD